MWAITLVKREQHTFHRVRKQDILLTLQRGTSYFQTAMMLIADVIVLQGIFIFMWTNYVPLTYNRTYSYPSWALAVGMCMAFASMTCIPLYLALTLLFAPGTLKQVSAVTGIHCS